MNSVNSQTAPVLADAERLEQELRAIAGDYYIADGCEPNVLCEAADTLAVLRAALGQALQELEELKCRRP